MTPKTSSEERVARQPLNPNAQKWVEALRSGKYRQGRNKLLNTYDEYCCLGVAAQVAEESGVACKWRGSLYLPVEIQNWLGLKSNTGDIKGGHCLAWQNDNLGKSFREIADIIESQPEGLFVEVTA